MITSTFKLNMKCSVAILATLILTACGGGSDSGSSGSTSVSVPNVVGDTQAAASTAITGAGLTVGTVTTQSSSTVASGEVISENPAASTSVAKGSAVALVVSSGGAPVSVPNVVGDTQAAASTALTGAGLVVGTVTTQASATVASGKVISENPAAATSVAKGSAVALVVSSGPATYTIGGTLIGLGTSATVQVLNGTDTKTLSANGTFALPTAVLSGVAYTVTVGTTTGTQTCTVQNGTGTVATANVTSVVIYCTYNVTAATLVPSATYTTVVADFNNNGNSILGGVVVANYDGVSAYSGNATFNVNGGVSPQPNVNDVYQVNTTNGIAALTTNSGASGGIEGVNANAVNGVDVIPIQPGISVGVLPSATATTASINGNYTLVSITAAVSTGAMSGYDATITLTNGTIAGTYVENTGTAITTNNTASGTWSVASGTITAAAFGTGAISADGDLVVLADTTNGDDPAINVAVHRGTGVTKATFEGVYSVSGYGGAMASAAFGKAMTLFAYGNGTYSTTFTLNAAATVTTGKTSTGTYVVTADGTLTLTDSSGEIYTGAIAADGNALVLASVTAAQKPELLAGIRQ